SVIQKAAEGLSFFVGPEVRINTTLRGRVTFRNAARQGMVGFVFGYRSPAVEQGSANNRYDLVLLDWSPSQPGHSTAAERLSLSRLDGTVSAPARVLRERVPNDAMHVLAETQRSGLGWRAGKSYDVEIRYRRSRVQVWIDRALALEATGSFPE